MSEISKSFTYPMVLQNGDDTTSDIEVGVALGNLPLGNPGDAAILVSNHNRQGLYFFIDNGWRLCVPQDELCAAAIFGRSVVIYMNVTSEIEVPSGTLLYRNGAVQPDSTPIEADGAVWVTATPAAGGSGGGMINPMGSQGDMITADPDGNPVSFSIGAQGQVLTVGPDGYPAWEAAGGGGGGMTNPMTSVGDLIVGGGAGTPQRLAAGAQGSMLRIGANSILQWLPMCLGVVNDWGLNPGANVLDPTRPNVTVSSFNSNSYIDLADLEPNINDTLVFCITVNQGNANAVDVVNSASVGGQTAVTTVYPGETALLASAVRTATGFNVFKNELARKVSVQVKQGDPANGYAGNMFIIDRTLGNDFVLNIERTPATIQYPSSTTYIKKLGDKMNFTAVLVYGFAGPATINWSFASDGFYWDVLNSQSPSNTITADTPLLWSAEFVGGTSHASQQDTYKAKFRYADQAPVKFTTTGASMSCPGATIDPTSTVSVRRLDGGRICIEGSIKATITDVTTPGILQLSGFMPSPVPLDLRAVPATNRLGLTGNTYSGNVWGLSKIKSPSGFDSNANTNLHVSPDVVAGVDVLNLLWEGPQLSVYTTAAPYDFSAHTVGDILTFSFKLDMEVESLSHT